MGIRQWMNENSGIATIIAGGVLVLAIIVMVLTSGGQNESAEPTVGRYFMDLTTNEPFVAPVDAVPPIDSPGGAENMAVRAIYLTCGSCRDRYLGWLEKFTPQAKQLYLDTLKQNETQQTPLPAELVVRQSLPNGMLVRSPDGGEWVSENSPMGQQIVKSARNKCGEKPAQSCDPAD